ncbi:putative Ig domain-containing protein [Deinococcus sedimenti]|uniref:Cell surface protein n=1 Tax=Deinococcus sedimenti TaxID=1867090 RepID=A0ABQ2S9E3_9DEIO|nr:putative Ig domain-containing protein [Deinococcus sedimenti]GGS03014.1 hypothetical protein GCM10008960_32050 [Deinococcus sedimenti]
MRRLSTVLLPAALLLSSCGTGAFSNPFIQPIEVTLNPSAVALAPGSSTRVQVTGKVSGTADAVTGLNITAREVPAELSVTPSTGALTVTVKPGSAPGTYSVPLAITATGGSGTAVLAVTVTPTTRTPYTITPITSLTVQPGQQRRVSITPDRAGELATDVRITGITGALNVTRDTDPLGFTISAAATQTVGTYVMQITTTDGTQTLNTPLTVNVEENK